jgi:hypothetical protein
MESNNIHSIRQLDPVIKNIQNDIGLEKCETWMDYLIMFIIKKN